MESISGTRGPRTTGGRRRALRSLALVASGGLLLAGLAATNGAASAQPAAAQPAADPPPPALKLLVRKGKLLAYGNNRGTYAYASLPMLVQAASSDLDLRVKREPGVGIIPGEMDSYSNPVTVKQVLDGTATELPGAKVGEYWNGLQDFWHVEVKNTKGKPIASSDFDFCPNAYEAQRIDPDSVDENQYPQSCYGQPFTIGARYGISKGWAVPATEQEGIGFPGKIGSTYTVTLSVNQVGDDDNPDASVYRDLFGGATEISAALKVKKQPREEDYRTAARQATRQAWTGGDASPSATTPAARKVEPENVRTLDEATVPDSALPDLKSLPSSGIGVSKVKKKQYLNFGATVWVDGNSRLDVEGFRNQDDKPDEMTAYQYFYDSAQDNKLVGKQEVGTMEYHRAGGHNHWHLEYFANYELVKNPTDHESQVSGKQSFCLAPTDAVDLAREGADYLHSYEDLGSSCGSEDAMWIRETLPLGWGDTYTQQKGGQAFDITTLTPGVYYIRITANPTVEDHQHGVAAEPTEGALFETDKTNNVSLRKVVISKKKDGTRTVCVPAVDGLDPEGTGLDSQGGCKQP